LSRTDEEHRPIDPSGDLSRARAAAHTSARELGRPDLAEDAALVLSELLTNAILHGGGCTGMKVGGIAGGLRIEVRDRSRLPPMIGRPFAGSLTGRGLRLVAALSARWGADGEANGKVVWAEITGEGQGVAGDVGEDALLAMWAEDWEDDGNVAVDRHHVELGDVPTDLLLAAKTHVDNLVRELTLASAGAEAGQTAAVPPHLRSLLEPVVERFAEARLAIKRQALAAARRGDERTRLTLELPVSAADAAEAYLAALDELDAYCRARRLLTLETPPQHQLFRHWYVQELVAQLRAAADGAGGRPPQSFEARLLAELDRIAGARRAAERAARLYSVAAALATAATPEAVAEAVLHEGVAALGAAAGDVLLASDSDRLTLPGAVGYDEDALERLRHESPDAELPAAVALRTGEAVWLESRAERDARFPELQGLEAQTVALCAVPLEVQGRRLGAVRFSFHEARLFDEEEKQFVLALAAQTAQALERAQLQRSRIEVSRRLQRSLLPPSIPEIPRLEVAAIYNPVGDGIDVGGDFYDVWSVRSGEWAFAIGDATGTGPEAAALTALVRHTLRALTISQSDPAEVVRTLNTALLEAASDVHGERFCTAVFGLINVGAAIEVRLASGGHPPPLRRRAGGHIDVLPVYGSLLGVFDDTDVESLRVTLEPGDSLVMFTDGVLEARNAGRFFDLDGVLEVLRSGVEGRGAVATAAALEKAVLDHTGGVLTDDMAAVVLHVP
jgi:serine phosphatase RsbU (regulator of sigma subunit)